MKHRIEATLALALLLPVGAARAGVGTSDGTQEEAAAPAAHATAPRGQALHPLGASDGEREVLASADAGPEAVELNGTGGGAERAPTPAVASDEARAPIGASDGTADPLATAHAERAGAGASRAAQAPMHPHRAVR